MDKSKLISKLEAGFPGAVLQVQRFGKTETQCLWIEGKRIREVARGLKEDFGFNILENLSVMQIDDALVLTYFLRTSDPETGNYGECLIVRLSAHLKKPNHALEVASIVDFWATALPFEMEAGELFGIHFVLEGGTKRIVTGLRLPVGWRGYPLRKNYVFPESFSGVRHERAWIEKAGGKK
ncbi:MAG: hypothetical protein A2070_06125 [Bdellovibrionales bacterium GWC1_52_8]|nr:MAG: hypothetical protein A2Z97_14300 [Bdellovibrionales bacterium GWB1_52_6]OFZ04443.1 MAG: hypothetical protein A2X97_07305 [Bdellovibrionales bacterium GWA1_52_35]OFZ40559.1 MAG: hypothetical protein A2070_06125 [Bdellovibrionales bacterium GWC1_52_8]